MTTTRKTSRARSTEKITLEDLVEMLAFVHRELGLVVAGMNVLIRKAGADAAIVPKVPSLLVGPYCQGAKDVIPGLGGPVEAATDLARAEELFDVAR